MKSRVLKGTVSLRLKGAERSYNEKKPLHPQPPVERKQAEKQLSSKHRPFVMENEG